MTAGLHGEFVGPAWLIVRFSEKRGMTMRGFGHWCAGCSLLLALTLASGAQAATYYVRNGGNDGADGRSHATAWATIAKVNGQSLKSGDSVLFHQDHVFAGVELKVRWSGTTSQHAVIGAYYVENGSEKRGFRGARPVIDGQDRAPDTRWSGMVNILADRVRVENLEIVNSEGMGVRCNETSFAQVVNVVVRNTYDAAIRFRSCKDGLIEDNHVSDAARAWPEDGKDLYVKVKWASAIVAHHWSDRTVIRRNTVSKVFGEGINIHHGTVNALVEENFVFAARAGGIYIDAAPNTTVRRNIVVGTSEPQYWRDGDRVGPGIVLNNEHFHYEGGSNALSPDVRSHNAVIYANLVANTARGLAFWGNGSTAYKNTLIYNNTLVGNEYQLWLTGSSLPGGQVVNNILHTGSSDAGDVAGEAIGLTAKNNYFSQGDPGGLLSHSSNLYKGLHLARMTGWREIREPGEVSWRDFMPNAGSSSIGVGADIQISKALGPDGIALDFNLTPQVDPIDTGAVRRTFSKVPNPPRDVTSRTN